MRERITSTHTRRNDVADYYQADEPENIANRLLGNHPTVANADFLFVFKEKATKRGDKRVVGSAFTIPNKYRPGMKRPYDFIIVIGHDKWQELSNKVKMAWIDHLLACCIGEEVQSTGEMRYKTRKPTVAGFPEVINRHGVNWDDDLNKLSVIDLEGKNMAERGFDEESS